MDKDKRLFLCDKDGNPQFGVPGFSVSGHYIIEHENGDHSNWRCAFQYSSGCAEKPVVVLFPGYRMRGTGCGGKRVAEILKQKGFSTLLMDYARMGRNKTDEIDVSTMTTQIADADAAISFLGQRECLYFTISYGVNIAMQVLRQNTGGMVCVIPAPDRFQRNIYPCVDLSELGRRGFIRHSSQNAEALKITDRFLHDSLQYTVFDQKLVGLPEKPQTHLLLAGHDHRVHIEDNIRWADFLETCGFPVTADIDMQGIHMLTPGLLVQAIECVPMVAERARRPSSHRIETAAPPCLQYAG